MKVLIKWEEDWADEFDMVGFIILEKEVFDNLINRINSAVYPFEAYFGTNEAYTFEEPQDVISKMQVKTITDGDSTELERIFGSTNMGWTPYGAF